MGSPTETLEYMASASSNVNPRICQFYIGNRLVTQIYFEKNIAVKRRD